MSIMSMFTAVKDIWGGLSAAAFIYVVVNEIRSLKAAKAAGTPNKTLLADFLSWVKKEFFNFS